MIKGLQDNSISAFKGKHTTVNLADAAPGTLLSAKNVMILSDGQLRRTPGYTKVATVGSGPIRVAGWDFQRNVDHAQFVFVQSGDEIWVMNADGTGKRRLSTGETGTHQFVNNSFVAYSSDGNNAWRYVDKAGVLTKYKWGLDAPATAPAIGLGAGTLSLTYGRTYVYCFVAKYTDSLGIQRLSIGPPSPVSAHTGPLAAQVVTLSALAVSSDPQVNYKWIFEVSDSPINTSATYYFAAEIANATTSWGDTLLDDALDSTRLAPFDNFAPPPSPMLAMWQNRIALAKDNLIQLTGFSEVVLGIPEETAPQSLFFSVPSGKRTISAITSLQQGTVLVVSTQEFWYLYTGYDAATFTEQDKVASPGAAGPLALVMTPEGLAYLAANQSMRLWQGAGLPAELSGQTSKHLQGTYAQEDIDPAYISAAKCCWYDYGPMNMLVVFARTVDSDVDGFNLMQLWSFATEARDTSGEYGAGSGVYTQLIGTFQTDKFPHVGITAAGSVDVGFAGQNFIYLGDANGNIYRWPDGFTDNGNPSLGVAQLAWALPHDGKSRFYWSDLVTDRVDAGSTFSVFAATADAPDQSITPTKLEVQMLPSPVDQSGLAIRASMNAPGVATGKYVTLFVEFPSDDKEATVSKVTLASRPLNQGIA